MRKRPLLTAIAAFALVAGLSAGAAAVTAEPSTITFNSRDESQTIHLSQDGKPVSAGQFNGYMLSVSGHTYEYMVDVKAEGNTITVTPTDQLEIGRYDLTINTDLGPAHVTVHSPLSNMPNSLENRAKTMGITKEELENRLGETEVLYKATETHVIPSTVWYRGEAYAFPRTEEEGITRRYYVDNEPVTFDSENYEYRFDEPGLYSVGYQDLRDDEVIGAEHGLVTVTEQPPLRYLGSAGKRVELTGPTGYKHYHWYVGDEAIVNDNERFEYTFDKPGTYDVRVEASDPDNPAHNPAHTFHYRVEVQ